MADWLQPWFADLPSFLRMGRHGIYVWSGLGLAALVIAAEWLALVREARRQRHSGGRR